MAETRSGLETSLAEGDSLELLWGPFPETQPKASSLSILWALEAPGVLEQLYIPDFYGNLDFISVGLLCQKHRSIETKQDIL